jgi:excisionase family DNA binding protein
MNQQLTAGVVMEEPPQHNRQGLATVKDAERFLNMSRSGIYALMDSGQLKYTKIGKSRRIPWETLHELVQKNMVG